MPARSRSDSERLAADYRPNLPADAWAHVRLFVVEVVAEVATQLPYPIDSQLNAVAHHVDWCVNLAGFELARERLFRRDVIGAAVANMPTRSTSAMGRRRSILLRIGEVLGVIAIPHPLPRLAPSEPTAPYTEDEILELRAWAHNQRDSAYRASARALLALGLGGGLPTRDLFEVRAEHVLAAGSFIIVSGANPRLVPVLSPWHAELSELAATRKTGALFRPGTTWHKNVVTVFASRSTGIKVRPSTQRMRAYWLVHHLAAGMPMQDLLHAAGLASMDALVRYQKFLPEQSLAARLDTTTRRSLESAPPTPRHPTR